MWIYNNIVYYLILRYYIVYKNVLCLEEQGVTLKDDLLKKNKKRSLALVSQLITSYNIQWPAYNEQPTDLPVSLYILNLHPRGPFNSPPPPAPTLD